MTSTEQIARRYFEGRDAFLDAGAFPATRGPRTIRVVERLTVRDGRIHSSVFVTDMAALAAFAGAGPAGGDDDRR